MIRPFVVVDVAFLVLYADRYCTLWFVSLASRMLCTLLCFGLGAGVVGPASTMTCNVQSVSQQSIAVGRRYVGLALSLWHQWQRHRADHDVGEEERD